MRYTVTATDTAGNTAQATGSIQIDTVSNVSIRLDASSDSGSANNDGITNEQTPFLSGAGEAGASISVTINANNYVTTVNADGTWSLQVTDTLPDGDHTYTVLSTDIAGNSSSASGSLTIDTETTVDAALAIASDSGVSSVDGITSVQNPVFSGTAEVGASISLEIGGETYTGVVDASGEWSIQVTETLADSQYEYTVTAVDVAGNTAESDGSITIDSSTNVTIRLDASSDSGNDQ